MAYNTADTSTATLTGNIAIYYEKKLLSRLKPNLELYKFGSAGKEWKPIPFRSGKVVQWTIYTNLTAAITALTEGTTPTGTALSSSTVSAQVSQYGDYSVITDFIDMVAIDPTFESAAELFGEQAALTVDTLIRNELSGGTAQLARAKSNITDLATSDTLIASEIRKAVRTLETNKARPHRLTPGFYPLFCHPSTKYDLIGDDSTGGWLDVRKYVESKQREIEMNKIGDVYGAKAFMTQNLGTVSSTVQTYNNLMISDESFGITKILKSTGKSGNPWTLIVKQPGAGEDPLNQRGSVGWKMDFKCKLLDANRVIVLKTGATA